VLAGGHRDGGGYGKKLDDTVDVYEATVRAALHHHQLSVR